MPSLRFPIWKKFLEKARWYGAKSREIVDAEARDSCDLSTAGEPCACRWAILTVRFTDGTVHEYQLPALLSTAQGEMHEHLESHQFLRFLKKGFSSSPDTPPDFHFRTFPAARGQALAWPPENLERLEAKVMGGEMSNTLLSLGGRFIVKIYRRLFPGLHPELEAMDIFSRVDFRHAPRPIGAALYRRSGGEEFAILLVLEDLGGAAGLWERFVSEGDAGKLSALAARLGEVTAECHRAFWEARAVRTPPGRQIFTGADLAPLDRLAAAAPKLEGEARALAGKVLERRAALRAVLLRPFDDPVPFLRVHGDYHLGQVLHVEKDDRLAILDWEGEPARDFSTRRLYWPAAWDVASMLRSFSYARLYARREKGWEENLGESFLNGYWSRAQGAGFLPAERGAFEPSLRFFKLGKAVYEIGYEIDHRPTEKWLRIPLEGILELLE